MMYYGENDSKKYRVLCNIQYMMMSYFIVSYAIMSINRVLYLIFPVNRVFLAYIDRI